TLRVDPEGLTVTAGLRPRHVPWAAVTGVHAGAVTHGRRLVHVRVLTIDTIDAPVLLSRRQLGADPDRVAEVVERHRLDHA
nr:PH domain-containing protein [Micromonospora sp. DSM 115978]